MTEEQKRFILKKLIPFILREDGRGFVMDIWGDTPIGATIVGDGIRRAVPSCGTVACIGGSIAVLAKLPLVGGASLCAAHIGLTYRQGMALFFGLEKLQTRPHMPWPLTFRKRYAQARTPLAKAQVAGALLKEVARTGGKCLG